MLKQLIKDMAAQQIQLKKARKTGTYEIKRGEHGWPILPDNVLAATRAAAQARRNAVKITAALNLYRVLRGKETCHNVPSDYESKAWYKKDYEELAGLFQKQ